MATTSGTPLSRHEIQPPDGMALLTKIALVLVTVLFLSTMLAGQQKPFPVTSVVDAPTIAGHPVQLDERGKLLPWPMPYDIGYSYSSHFLTQWTILWDQHNRQRLHYYYCCFDFDRTTFELAPDPHWANSTGYLLSLIHIFRGTLSSFASLTGLPPFAFSPCSSAELRL